jgi:O-antigen/teichoic acid export membrane protein
MLFSSQTASMFAGFFASIILGRWMEPDEMGRFAFCLSIIVVTSLLFEFGISSAGARVLALAGNRASERQALGALVLMTVAISLFFSVFIVAAAKPIDLIFEKDVRWLFIGTAALAFFQPFQSFIEQSCQGLNQIRRLSVYQLTMSGCYLLGLIVLAATHRLTAGTALGAYLAGVGVSSVWTLIQMQPSFAELIAVRQADPGGDAGVRVEPLPGEDKWAGLLLARISWRSVTSGRHGAARYVCNRAEVQQPDRDGRPLAGDDSLPRLRPS